MNPQAKVTLAAIIIGTLYGATGTILGIIWLLNISGTTSITINHIMTHPQLQIFGFLTLFITGTSFTLIPRFKNKKLSPMLGAYTAIASIALGNLLFTLGWQMIGNLLLITGSVIYATLITRILGRPSGPMAVTEPFLHVGALGLVLSTLSKTIIDSGLLNPAYPYYHKAFLQIALLGFAGSTIWGVTARTIHFRIATLRKEYLKASTVILITAITSSFTSLLLQNTLLDILSPVLFFIASVLYIVGVNGFSRKAPKKLVKMMKESDRKRFVYFDSTLRLAFLWLTASMILMLAQTIQPREFWLRDAFIHSFSVGFIATVIMAYAPILLPVLVFDRASHIGLTRWPVYLVSIGNAWRLTGGLISTIAESNTWYVGVSGLLVAAGFISFFLMVHRLRVKGGTDTKGINELPVVSSTQ